MMKPPFTSDRRFFIHSIRFLFVSKKLTWLHWIRQDVFWSMRKVLIITWSLHHINIDCISKTKACWLQIITIFFGWAFTSFFSMFSLKAALVLGLPFTFFLSLSHDCRRKFSLHITKSLSVIIKENFSRPNYVNVSRRHESGYYYTSIFDVKLLFSYVFVFTEFVIYL